MVNSIEFAKNYTGILDEVYQRAAVSRRLNSGGRMVRAGRSAKEILIPKISVTGFGDYICKVGHKTGSITYEYETHNFGYDRAIRLFADVMDVEESDVLDCFVEAGAELQSTALLLHELAHAGVDACPHVCRQRREVAPVAALCRHLLWGAWLHWRVPPG